MADFPSKPKATDLSGETMGINLGSRLGAKETAWEHGSCVHCVTVDPARAIAPLGNFLDLPKTQNERWLWHNSHEWVPPSMLDQTSPKGPIGGRMCWVGEGVAKTHN